MSYQFSGHPMNTKNCHQDTVRPFVVFSAFAGLFVGLGLSAEQLVGLFNECLQVAKYHHDHKLCLCICHLAAQKNQKLGNNDNVLLYAKEILEYTGMFGSVLKERYEVCRCLIIRGKGIVSHDPESKTVLVAIAAVLAESIWLKNMEKAAYYLLGISYVPLNQLEDTIPCILRLIEIATEMSDNRGLAHGYHFLLAIYHTLNQYDQVVICAKKYIDLAKEINLNDGLSEAYCLLIYSCRKLKRHDQVIKYAREYFDVAQMIQVHPEGGQEGDSVFVLADLLDNLEQYDHAVIDGKKCYKIPIKVDSCLCGILLDLGKAYLELQTEEKTLFYCEQAIKLVKQYDEPSEDINSSGVLQQALHIAGLACCFKSHYAKAHDYFSQFLKIAEESKDSANIALSSELISALNTTIGVCNSFSPNLSELTEISKKDMVTEESLNNIQCNIQFLEKFEIAKKHELDQEFELALSCYKKLERLILDASPFAKLIYTPIRMSIAQMNFQLHRFDTASSLYREICKEAQMNGQTNEEAECQHMIGLIHFARVELANAENYARKSVECFEKVFDVQRTKEEFQIAIVDKYIQYYELLTLILIITNQNIEALETVDRYRARALKTQLILNYQMDHDIQEKQIQYSDIQSLVSKSQCTILQYFNFRIPINCFMKGLFIFVVPCENEDKLIRHQPNFSFEDMEKSIERAYSEMKVRRMDCENRSLNTDTETDDGKRTREDDFKEDAFEVEAVRTLSSQEEKPPEGNESSFNSALEILYSKLIQNVISDIQTDEIVFIPDGPLFKVPFAALRNPAGHYLSETKRIRIAPSISTLKILNDRPADVECEIDVLIVGDPSVDKVICNGKEKEIPALKSAFNEAFAIKHVFRGHSMEVLLQEEATKTAVLEKLQQGASIVHIAAHGNAAKATIALAPLPEVRASKIPEEDDYMLTMADVQKVNVRAKLVVLSCCHSGRGEIKAEGVVGMCRAFLASGACAVVASLCAIDDNATRLFMMEFYRNLKEKKSASLSLHLAMKYMREEVTSQRKRTVVRKSKGSGILYSEPRYWAPFFLIGDDVIVF